MTHFLFFCVASVGLTAILVEGKIFQPIRAYFAAETERIRRRREKKNLPPSFSLTEKFHEILGCFQCCGFWSGLFCGLFLLLSGSFLELSLSPRSLVCASIAFLCCGFIGSILSLITDHVVRHLFLQTELVKLHLSQVEHQHHEHEQHDEHSMPVDDEDALRG